ncbi:hypothetical protein BH09BAC1_BH09BAC1_06570 [soil metagenome]
MANQSPNRNQHPLYDVCIVGAGVAGSALAWYLGTRGVKVAIVERDLTEPDKFIGELLQPGGVMQLQAMGHEEVLEGFDAQPIQGYALFNGSKSFQIPYPVVAGTGITGRGFRYGKFVMSLRQKLYDLPNVTVIEGSVNKLVEKPEAGVASGIYFVSTTDREEQLLKAHLTVISDGSLSRFRGELTGGERHIKSYMMGLLLHDCALPHPNHGHVFMSGTSPFLAYPVSSNETRVLINFPGEKSPMQGGRAQHYFHQAARQLPGYMQNAFKESTEVNHLKAMPAMMVSAKPTMKPGFVVMGDALNVRHPLTGGGMTAALTDVRLLGQLLFAVNDFKNPVEMDKALQEFFVRRNHCNATINILADALYEVFSSPDLKDACFNYLNRGGNYVKGPVSILSAVSRDKQVLLKEFFAVALFGAGNLIKAEPSAQGMVRAHFMMREALDIITPLLMNEQPSFAMKGALNMGQLLFPKPAERPAFRENFTNQSQQFTS